MPWHARYVAPANPERWASTVVLGDGASVLIRPITPDDRDALAEFHIRQSHESQYRRYFTAKPRLSASELDHFTRVDFIDRVALIVEAHGEFVAWASYERWPNRDDADAAFMVDDLHHGRGIATLLLEHLAAIARSNGIARFTAEVLAENRAMLSVFSRAGWPLQRRFESGVIDLDFELADTSEFLDSVERREQRADSRAISRLLLPRSMAVIGASDKEDTVGRVLWHNAARTFSGPLYPVNPNHDTIGGRTAYATIGDVPDDITVAVVAVPAEQLEVVLDQCIAKRVRGAVIVTEVGDTVDMGAIVTRARRNGLRLIGPGSMGIASPLPSTLIQAAIVDARVPAGGVAISMQSGTLGSSLLALAHRLDMGLSWFVSLGDKSDVSGDDLLQFWEDDEATKVIALYTESHGNPHKFARIARRVSQRRPIVAVRTGAALIGQASGALYQQAGLIEVPTVAALLDTARVMASQPLMAGPAVTIVTNSRSPGVLAAAAVEAAGLHIVEPPFALDWTSSDEDYERAVRSALEADDVDAVLVIHAPAVASAISGPIDHIDRAATGSTKPVVAVMLGAVDGRLRRGSAVPTFAFPEPAVAALGRIHSYWRWRTGEGASVVESPPGIDLTRAARVIRAAVDAGRDQLSPGEIHLVLDCYGVAMAAGRLVPFDEAVAEAAVIGYPVAVKAVRRRPGRSAQAGVALDLARADDVRRAVAVMREHLGDDAAEVLVQRMVPPGVDLRIQVVAEGDLGPVVTVGLGGAHAEAIGDESSRLAPVSSAAARSMLEVTRAGAALDYDLEERFADVIVRVAQLASDHPALIELDLNPVILADDSCWVTDASARLSRLVRAEPAMRRLE
jgi:acyl-CoA synthetase (NDP forming)/GNAT superfamily N-acetyltransferase